MSRLQNKAVYCGYDPTSDSLHLGNLVSIIMMGRLSLLGLKPIFLVGGATGLIGDPSGKLKERALLAESQVHNNIKALQTEIGTIYNNIQNDLQKHQEEYSISPEQLSRSQQRGWKLINNYNFYKEMDAIRFLRQVGKHFRMGSLLSKQVVANRLNSQDGISYAQFSYSIIQAYDFLQLYQQEDCLLQFGGSDQWGNITNGCDLVRKSIGQEVFGITMPLLLTKTGQKFGKSQGNALYLNPNKTSADTIFNYFLNSSDQDIEKYLHIFTFLPQQKINQLMSEHNQKKEAKLAQKTLGQSVLRLIRPGQESVSQQRQFFTLSHEELIAKDELFFRQLFEKMQKDNNQYYKVCKSSIKAFPCLLDMISGLKLSKSKSEARRQVDKGGLYLNNKRVTTSELNAPIQTLLQQNVLHAQFLLFRWGKKKYQFVQLH